jgi:hypothetical protein
LSKANSTSCGLSYSEPTKTYLLLRSSELLIDILLVGVIWDLIFLDESSDVRNMVLATKPC